MDLLSTIVSTDKRVKIFLLPQKELVKVLKKKDHFHKALQSLKGFEEKEKKLSREMLKKKNKKKTVDH